MPKRLSKPAFDQEVYNLWMSRLCTFGLKQAKKMVYAAYKELRRQDDERKKKHGSKTNKKTL